jgi:hypothetical protein
MQVSPGQNPVWYAAGSPAVSAFVSSAGSNMPIAWCTPRQKVRSAWAGEYHAEKKAASGQVYSCCTNPALRKGKNQVFLICSITERN